MTRLRTGLLALVLPAVLLIAGPAQADSPGLSQVADALKTSNVLVDPTAEAASLVDQVALKSAIGNADIKVAILPAATTSGSTETAVEDLSKAIGDRKAFTIAIIGKRIDAAAGPDTGAPTGQAESLARSAFADHQSGGFTAANVQGALIELIADASAGLSSGTATAPDRGQPATAAKKSHSNGVLGLVVLVVILGLLGLAGFAIIRSSRRKKAAAQQQFDAARAEVDGLYSRLANDVTTLDPGDNATAKQAMSDASERYNTAGAGLSSSTSVGQLAAVRRTVIEGIAATRSARTALGLDPGPDPVPAPEPNAAPPIGNGQYVNVGQQSYQGYGSYQPGNPYYFGGGYYNGGYVPGGWYGTPFWEQLLITEAVFGGFGGWGWGGGGYGYGYGGGFGYGNSYGGGYNQGYDSGYNQGVDAAQSGGGDWGSNTGGGDWGGGGGGGGDWGGGGGDFGGGGGGGDWGGGGGGDSGGGGGGW